MSKSLFIISLSLFLSSTLIGQPTDYTEDSLAVIELELLFYNTDTFLIKSKQLQKKFSDEKKSQFYFEVILLQAAFDNDRNGNLSILKKIKEEDLISISTNHRYLSCYYFFLAWYWYNQNEYHKALLQNEKAYELNQQGNKFLLGYSSLIINQLARCHSKLGDYDLADNYFQLAIWKAETLAFKATYLNNTAKVFFEVKEYDKAAKYFEKTIALEKHLKNHHFDVEKRGIYRLNFSKCLRHLEKYDSAIIFINEAEKYALTNKELLGQINEEKGNIFFAQRREKEAVKHYDKTLQLYQTAFPQGRHPRIAQLYLNQARLFSRNKEYKTALKKLQKAYFNLAHDFVDTLDVSINPELTRIIDKPLFLKVLLEKAKIQKDAGLTSAATKTFELGEILIDQMRQKDLYGKDSKYFWQEQASNFRADKIALNITLNEPELAYQSCQKNHGVLLAENVKNIEAKNLGNVPDGLLKREQALKVAIDSTRKVLFSLTPDSAKYDLVSNQLNIIERELQVLQKKMEEEYSAYYQLKYQKRTATVEEIQKRLPHNKAALIEYLVTRDKIYAFVITYKGLDIYPLDKPDALDQQIEQYRSLLGQFNNSKETFKTIEKFSYHFYNLLLKPILIKNEGLKTLIIVPDDKLNYLSFTAFTTKQTNHTTARYDQLPYLLEQYDISYIYSSELFANPKKTWKRSFKEIFTGFAPSFSSPFFNVNRNKLDSLLFNVPEVESVKEIVGGKIYTGKDATVDSFKLSVGTSKILHIASHAGCNDQFPDQSNIFLADGAITAGEIHNLPINNHLAVLSACETSKGTLKKGEGLISLASAFLNAGSKSVLTSMWRVNDKRASTLMQLFYKNVYEKQPTYIALNNAQRAYLEDANSPDSHPFYWATFIHIGDISAVYEPTNWYSWGFGLVVLLFLVFLYRRN